MASILVVEDQPSLQKLFQEPLAAKGYEVLAAADGASALKMVDEHEVDLIILDLLLPIMDGMNFLRAFKLRKQPTKVIIFTNFDSPEFKHDAAALDVHDFYVKAEYTPTQLIELVDKTLSK